MQINARNKSGKKLRTSDYAEKVFYLTLIQQRPTSKLAKRWIQEHPHLLTHYEKSVFLNVKNLSKVLKKLSLL